MIDINKFFQLQASMAVCVSNSKRLGESFMKLFQSLKSFKKKRYKFIDSFFKKLKDKTSFLILKKNHERIIREKEKFYKEEIENTKKIRKDDKRALDKVFERFTKIQWNSLNDRNVPIYRITVDIDIERMKSCFSWGNDDRLIDYMQYYIGKRAVYEFKQLNKIRLTDFYRSNIGLTDSYNPNSQAENGL